MVAEAGLGEGYFGEVDWDAALVRGEGGASLDDLGG